MTDNTPSLRAYRFAVYFAPDLHSPWWAAGSQWLGRDAAAGQALTQPPIAGVDDQTLAACTAEPRRYGWHATLKAPFTLAPEHDLDSLLAHLQGLAERLPAFDLPPLRVSTVGHFLALRPQADGAPKGAMAAIASTAAACVTELQALALPLSDAELARRRQADLTAEQDQLLLRWGYPWVLQHFHFHMSLSGPLAALSMPVRVALIQAAQTRFHVLPPCRFAHLSLFVQPQAGADFECLTQLALRG